MDDCTAEQLAVLTSVPYEPQAAVIVAALHSAGIRAVASGVLTAGFRAEGPGWVRVLVRQSDLSLAQHDLADLKARAAGSESSGDQSSGADANG